ncbi:hypothetical protein [Clostridium tyrobutyricum]|uniref:hypothetical protein n=1 Tax=Clostridium tyrobutyricum TaxID=1519 RepID=UPI0011CB41E3|nr:hypothetical protein [Clostridium tyrobutyricum]
MTDDMILDAIRNFLKEKIAPEFKLKKPQANNINNNNYELVSPAVYIGWVPPKNYLNEYGYDIPSLLVMEDGGRDNGEDASIDIRIGIATYDPGTSFPGVEKLNTVPDFKGYKDLLNIIQKIRMKLVQSAVISGITTVERSVKWGMYEEQQYPYWHGWISFKANTVPLNYENSEIEKYL